MGLSAGRPCGAGRGAGRPRRPAKWGGGVGVFQRGQRGADLFAGPAGGSGFFRDSGFQTGRIYLFWPAPLPSFADFSQ